MGAQEPVVPGGLSYWAFISYSHRDEPAARALHAALETYRVPAQDVGTETTVGRVPSRLYPCFRDREELAGAPSLGPSIERALSQSSSLIVVCSPHAAASRWVNEEIRRYRVLGHADRIFAYLVEGEPADAFPAALTEDPAFGEPLAADARRGGDGPRNALLKLVAGITGLRYADLTDRDAVRRRRLRNLRIGIGGALVALVLAAYVLLADGGAPLPFADATRSALDHYGFTMFRPVPSADQLRREADGLRDPLLTSDLAFVRTKWASEFEAVKGKNSLDTWDTAEYAAASLQVRGRPLAEERAYLPYLDQTFGPGVYHRNVRGEAYGWYGWSDPSPWPEPALWLDVAIADALSVPHLLGPRERALWLSRLALAQRASDTFGPHDGHWDVVPHELHRNQFDTFAAALALLAVFSARDAHLGWDGSEQRRDAIGRATAAWLAAGWQVSGKPLPRWNPDDGAYDYIDFAGLTLQIYGELLHAHELGYVNLPAAMPGAIEQRLNLLFTAPLVGDESKVDFREDFLNEKLGVQRSVRDVTFALLPPALGCSARFLKYLDAIHAPRERVAAIRRVAHRLLDNAQNLQADESFDRFAPVDAAYYLNSFDELGTR